MKFGGLQRSTSADYAPLHPLTCDFRSVYLFVAELLSFSLTSTFFLIKPLTADCRIFSSKDISCLVLLHRWHPITVPRWNSPSSWEQIILSLMLVEAVCMSRCLAAHTCAHGSDGTPEFNDLDGWVNTFGNIVYCCSGPKWSKQR